MVVRVIEAKEDKVTMADLIADLKNPTRWIIPELSLLLKVLSVERKKI